MRHAGTEPGGGGHHAAGRPAARAAGALRHAAVKAGPGRSWTELMYLSFALLSSTRIGDVIALTTHARALAAVEMFVGTIYLAAVVSRPIGLTLQRR